MALVSFAASCGLADLTPALPNNELSHHCSDRSTVCGDLPSAAETG